MSIEVRIRFVPCKPPHVISVGFIRAIIYVLLNPVKRSEKEVSLNVGGYGFILHSKNSKKLIFY